MTTASKMAREDDTQQSADPERARVTPAAAGGDEGGRGSEAGGPKEGERAGSDGRKKRNTMTATPARDGHRGASSAGGISPEDNKDRRGGSKKNKKTV